MEIKEDRSGLRMPSKYSLR